MSRSGLSVSCHKFCHRRVDMSSIRKRGETYQAQVRLSGGRASSATFKTKAEAQVWVREQAFILAQLPKNRDERTTLGDVIEQVY